MDNGVEPMGLLLCMTVPISSAGEVLCIPCGGAEGDTPKVVRSGTFDGVSRVFVQWRVSSMSIVVGVGAGWASELGLSTDVRADAVATVLGGALGTPVGRTA
jgi:hypothetical protein